MDLILEGVQIMFIGMAVVSIFLILLVFVMIFVGKLANFLDKVMPPKENAPQNVQVQGASSDKLIAAIIAIAHSKK